MLKTEPGYFKISHNMSAYKHTGIRYYCVIEILYTAEDFCLKDYLFLQISFLAAHDPTLWESKHQRSVRTEQHINQWLTGQTDQRLGCHAVNVSLHWWSPTDLTKSLKTHRFILVMLPGCWLKAVVVLRFKQKQQSEQTKEDSCWPGRRAWCTWCRWWAGQSSRRPCVSSCSLWWQRRRACDRHRSSWRGWWPDRSGFPPSSSWCCAASLSWDTRCHPPRTANPPPSPETGNVGQKRSEMIIISHSW